MLYGQQINRYCQPRTCLQQASLYADFLGEDAVVMTNKTHAFVVYNGKIYDSTAMKYTGLSVNDWEVRKIYGKKETWEMWNVY